MQNVLDAAAGKNSIPDKSVLLTFDDGYQSFYTRVFPILKKYRYPATVALIGTWIDGILSDREDVSPTALSFGRDVWGLPDQFEKLQSSPKMRQEWTRHKTELLSQFTDELANSVRDNRPGIKTARNLYALPLLKQDSEAWYAQSFKSFLAHYDYVAIEAMPLMEEKKPVQWLTDLVAVAAHYPEGLKKSVFELQAVNWKTLEKIPSRVFIGQLELLRKLGVHHIGYYPDDVFLDQPRLMDLQKHFSVPALP